MADDKSVENNNHRHSMVGDHCRKIKSTRQIILGWDSFNSISFLILIAFFIVWCLAYFIAYVPGEKSAAHMGNGTGGGGHAGHAGHVGYEY